MQYQPFLLNELARPEPPKPAKPPRHAMPEDEGREEQAEPDLEQFHQQAQEILEEARKHAEEVEREAYEQGFKQGEKDGQEIGSMKLEKILDRIEQISRDLDSYHETFVQKHEKEILSLVSAIAAKVIKAQVDLEPETVKNAVMEALSVVSDWQEVTVRVDPSDFEFLDEMRPEFFEKVASLRSINIVPDSSVEKGGCIVSSDFGEVDASIESRLDKVSQAIMDIYYSRR